MRCSLGVRTNANSGGKCRPLRIGGLDLTSSEPGSGLAGGSYPEIKARKCFSIGLRCREPVHGVDPTCFENPMRPSIYDFGFTGETTVAFESGPNLVLEWTRSS
jgi:hypothetical protein